MSTLQGACDAGLDISSCGAHGKCVKVATNAAACICDFGYAADERFPDSACQPINACTYANAIGKTLCLNGGTCSQASAPDMFKCDCPTSYSGQRCEIFDDPCTAPATCLNGGTCTYYPYVADRFLCSCVTGYSGTHCEVKESYGLGGVGQALGAGSTIVYWCLWLLMLLLFLYCLVIGILEWWQERVRKALENVRKSVVGPQTTDEADVKKGDTSA